MAALWHPRVREAGTKQPRTPTRGADSAGRHCTKQAIGAPMSFQFVENTGKEGLEKEAQEPGQKATPKIQVPFALEQRERAFRGGVSGVAEALRKVLADPELGSRVRKPKSLSQEAARHKAASHRRKGDLPCTARTPAATKPNTLKPTFLVAALWLLCGCFVATSRARSGHKAAPHSHARSRHKAVTEQPQSGH